MARFRSDHAREVYRAALKQGWRPAPHTSSGHHYICCPRQGCHFRMVFSGSDQYAVHKLHNTVAELRRHGFVWQGRGGKHTAERLNRKHSTSAG